MLARHYGVEVEVIDIGVDYEFSNVAGLCNCKVRRGTDNFSRGTAMTRSEARQSIETGIRLVEEVASENLFSSAPARWGSATPAAPQPYFVP